MLVPRLSLLVFRNLSVLICYAGAGAAANGGGGCLPAHAAGGAGAAQQRGATAPAGGVHAGGQHRGAARPGRLATRRQQPGRAPGAADHAAGWACYLQLYKGVSFHTILPPSCKHSLKGCNPSKSVAGCALEALEEQVQLRATPLIPARNKRPEVLDARPGQDIVPPALTVPERRLEALSGNS